MKKLIVTMLIAGLAVSASVPAHAASSQDGIYGETASAPDMEAVTDGHPETPLVDASVDASAADNGIMTGFGTGSADSAIQDASAGADKNTSPQQTNSFAVLWDDVSSGMQEQKQPSWGTDAADITGMQASLDQMYGASGAGQGAELASAISAATFGGASLTDSIASAFGVSLSKTPLFTESEMGFDPSARVDFGVLNESYAGMLVGMTRAEDTARADLSHGATSCMDSFKAAFGNINDMKLEAASLPEGFDPDAMLQSSLQGFESAYAGTLNSDAFQTAKSKIGIGNVFAIAQSGVNMDLNALLEGSGSTYARMQAGAGMTGGAIKGEFEGLADAARAKGQEAPSAADMFNLKTDAITNACKVIDMSNCMASDENGKIPSTNKPNDTANMTIGNFRHVLNTWQTNRSKSLSETINQSNDKRTLMADLAIQSMSGDDPETLQKKMRDTFGTSWDELMQAGTIPADMQPDSAPHMSNLDGIREDLPPLNEEQLREAKEEEKRRGIQTEEESQAIYREFQEKFYKETQEQRAVLGN